MIRERLSGIEYTRRTIRRMQLDSPAPAPIREPVKPASLIEQEGNDV